MKCFISISFEQFAFKMLQFVLRKSNMKCNFNHIHTHTQPNRKVGKKWNSPYLYLWECSHFLLFYQRVFELSVVFSQSFDLMFSSIWIRFNFFSRSSVHLSSVAFGWLAFVFTIVADNFTCHICFMVTVHRHSLQDP